MAAIVAAEVVTEAAEAAGVGGAVVGGVDGGAMTILAGYGPHAGGFGLAPGSSGCTAFAPPPISPIR